MAEGQELLRYTKARARGTLTRRKDEDRERGRRDCCGWEEEDDGSGGGDNDSTAAAVSIPGRCRFTLILTHCSISTLFLCAMGLNVYGLGGKEGGGEGGREGGRMRTRRRGRSGEGRIASFLSFPDGLEALYAILS